ncbi:MAG TPA: enoyl-CoA hydratase-related protein [Xanthobacteraceae bacterium]|nr:enoyl-CoA hydratase-related protein [Xanthobacteraceae bacterium]
MDRALERPFETLQIATLEGGILQVLLDRPTAANAMNTQMGRDLLALFGRLAAEPDAARCVVLSATGDRAFCAGGDLKERNGMTDAQWQAQHLIFERMIRAIIDCPLPVIAAVNGAAYGGGLEIALGCDFIYASRGARFALTEVTLGIMPGAGGTQNLPRAVGARRAKELILTGAAFSAEEALAFGLVNRVCEPGKLLSEAIETARRIARNGPLSVRQAKHAIHHGMEMSLANGMLFEIEAYNRLVPTEDRREGILAFNEKRSAQFKGR